MLISIDFIRNAQKPNSYRYIYKPKESKMNSFITTKDLKMKAKSILGQICLRLLKPKLPDICFYSLKKDLLYKSNRDFELIFISSSKHFQLRPINSKTHGMKTVIYVYEYMYKIIRSYIGIFQYFCKDNLNAYMTEIETAGETTYK